MKQATTIPQRSEPVNSGEGPVRGQACPDIDVRLDLLLALEFAQLKTKVLVPEDDVDSVSAAP